MSDRSTIIDRASSSSSKPPPLCRHEYNSCPHIQNKLPSKDQSSSEYRRQLKSTVKRFGDVVKWGATEGTHGPKRRRVAAPKCGSCDATLTRLHACLTCDFIGCCPLPTPHGKTCFSNHWAASNGKCSFALDSKSGGIYCCDCDNDPILSYTFEELMHGFLIEAEEDEDYSLDLKGRQRGRWKAWEPTEDERRGLVENFTKASCRGVRPLLNLSQTCFLSAILQSLIANPMLKAFFLSDKHNRHLCPNARGLAVGRPKLGSEFASNGTVGPDRERGCMCCEMDRAFEEFHSEDKSPWGPITMLYTMWHASAELEGYGQQDAHSFFLAALDQMHATAKGQMSSCNCIAHQTFSGSLTSTVTCSACKQPSVTVDPIMDIQLDFPRNASADQSISLASLLRRFCADERVGDQGKGYACSNCGGGSGATATKQLKVKKLPNVLSFQLKRFAHDATSTKIEAPVNFPSILDMRPYTEVASPDLADSVFRYDLFAVVTHEGKLDNGHYWADVLSSGEWWHCDDDKVTPTTLSAVRSQKAYMLFYVKRSLAYVKSNRAANDNITVAGMNGHANGNMNGNGNGSVNGH